MHITYPENLPVSAHRAEILKAVRENPVTIVCGDTGSGKTTQLPKMMLELGSAAKGRRIAVTQPRRLAAVTMAERVAEELGAGDVGGLVGYRHRYAQKRSSETRIEFLTDGVLLAETKFDRLLRMYDTIIVDEAHERSLNVDFLLGILKGILAKRGDLKVIVASATMDTEKFAAFFGAPVVNIPGRLFPIEYRYRPPDESGESDLPQQVAAAVAELPARDDILVFLSGERDIRETGEYLSAVRGDWDDVIPLLASLPAAEQRRAFLPSARRRIILATNVAETSVTIPGIRAVIDSGLARISRYIHRTQVQRLQVENISQASARQRAGRCGRLGPGICIRLYAEDDFLARDAYTAPEILRSSLAGVILTMLDLKLGAIDTFPFVDPPKPAAIREGLKELLELGAIRSDYALTEIGRKLARIPVEPRLARMLIAASENAVLPSALPIVAAMTCDDPVRRPMDEKEQAAQAHAKWRVAGSDFLGTLALWNWWRGETASLSQAKARKLAKKNYLAFPKMREWCELVRQLEALAKRLGLSLAEIPKGETHDAALHMSLLTGLLGRIGHYHTEDREYRGTHALRFALHPSSVLTKKTKVAPEWIVAGELLDTTRLFGCRAAVIDPRWIEPIAGPLCKHHVHSPAWDPSTGFVRATEQVTLYGLVIVEARRCDYARFAPEEAREIFYRHALLRGEFPNPPPVLRETLAFLKRLHEHAEKTRRPEVFDEMKLLAHFAACLPTDIANAPALRKYLLHASTEALDRFRLSRADWWPAETPADRDFPDEITLGKTRLRLTYRHTPNDPDVDGLTCFVRVSEVAALARWHDDWLVPGLLREKVAYLLACLPNSIRRLLRPIDDTLAILIDLLKPADESLEEAIRRAVQARWAFKIPESAWTNVRLPVHFNVRFVVKDDATGETLLATRDKKAVLTQFLPGVNLRVLTDPKWAARAQERTLVERLRLALTERLPKRHAMLPRNVLLFLSERQYAEETFRADVREGAIRASLLTDHPPIQSQADFEARVAEGVPKLPRIETERLEGIRAIIDAVQSIESLLASGSYPEATVDAVLEQLAFMVPKGFPRTVSQATLARFPRYLKAIGVRLERARVSPPSDRSKEARFAPYWQVYRDMLKPDAKIDPARRDTFRWLLEEYRLQLFAPELKTFEPVSPKRLDAILS